MIADAPFSKPDLVSCRNVLIYLEPDVQAKVIALFHFALLEGGYFLLSPAESIGSATDRFEPVTEVARVPPGRLGTPRSRVDANARVKRQGTYVPCTVTARPVADSEDADGLLLVTFQDRPAQPSRRRRTRNRPNPGRRTSPRSSNSSNTSSRRRARTCRARSKRSRGRMRI